MNDKLRHTMMTHPLWTDEYWLLLMQLYLHKPVGLKPTYSRAMVELALELHIPPTNLHEQMFQLRQQASPALVRLWNAYGESPRRLEREAKKVRRMIGFGRAQDFYEGVSVAETFEKDFRPLAANGSLKPVSLILVLDLYFRLTPITMVTQTPEVRELARLLSVKPDVVVRVMNVFQALDPCLHRDGITDEPLLQPCREVWRRFGNGDLEQLSAYAARLRDYFA